MSSSESSFVHDLIFKKSKIKNKKYYQKKRPIIKKHFQQLESNECNSAAQFILPLPDPLFNETNFSKSKPAFNSAANFSHYSHKNSDDLAKYSSDTSIDSSHSSHSSYSSDSPLESCDSPIYCSSPESIRNNDKDKEFPFSGSSSTVFDFSMAIYGIKMKHKLSDAAVNDLLKFFKLILPDNNLCPKTIETIEKKLTKGHDGLIYKICSKCESLSEGVEWLNNMVDKKENCKNISCSGTLVQFITFDIIEQLKSILTDKNMNQIKKNIGNFRHDKSK